MTEIAIKAQNVSKKFSRTLRRSMINGINDIVKSSIGVFPDQSHLHKGEFWAVDDVSFEVKKGETLAIIGPNGSGKSTLLKMLNGIYMPDTGSIKVYGKVGALIEVGAGFHPMLTGRENVYINGTILGMTKKEIDAKFDSIIDFADIGDFIDSPVKFYSSGMYVRLGFAVAVHCEPDILLVDEVLAVGDLSFRVKCFNKIADLMNNCAVVIVSHNMSAISRIASKCLVINKGNPCFIGSAEQGIQNYYSSFGNEEKIMNSQNQYEAQVTNVKLFNSRGDDVSEIRYNDQVSIVFDVKIPDRYKTFIGSIIIFNHKLEVVAQSDSNYNNSILNNSEEMLKIEIGVPNLILNPGKYFINITIYDEKHQTYLYWDYDSKSFSVVGDFIGNASVQLNCSWKVLNGHS